MLQTLLLLLAAISVHLSLSPPNPPVKPREYAVTVKKSLFEIFVQSVTFCSKSMVWIGAALDIIGSYTLAHAPSGSALQHVVCPVATRSISRVHPALLLGTLTVFAAAALRLWCFKALGHLFTFEVTIRPKHQLITTGPYAYARHPSYAGIYMTLLGATAVLCSPGTWLMECNVLSRGGVVPLAFWVVKCAWVFRSVVTRLGTEDEALAKTFGIAWDEYAKKVPYRLIPGVV